MVKNTWGRNIKLLALSYIIVSVLFRLVIISTVVGSVDFV